MYIYITMYIYNPISIYIQWIPMVVVLISSDVGFLPAIKGFRATRCHHSHMTPVAPMRFSVVCWAPGKFNGPGLVFVIVLQDMTGSVWKNLQEALSKQWCILLIVSMAIWKGKIMINHSALVVFPKMFRQTSQNLDSFHRLPSTSTFTLRVSGRVAGE